jgi:hypothetical protein
MPLAGIATDIAPLFVIVVAVALGVAELRPVTEYTASSERNSEPPADSVNDTSPLVPLGTAAMARVTQLEPELVCAMIVAEGVMCDEGACGCGGTGVY